MLRLRLALLSLQRCALMQVSQPWTLADNRFIQVAVWDVFLWRSLAASAGGVVIPSPPTPHPPPPPHTHTLKLAVHLLCGRIPLITNASHTSHTELLRGPTSYCTCLETVPGPACYIQLYYLKYSAFHNECESVMICSFHSTVTLCNAFGGITNTVPR